ncbi:major capsid protein [Escherichia coli]|uniref:major capsid protein n=1 Tax=Escherichia coli TaxID=562 RepID=UPI003F8C327B
MKDLGKAVSYKGMYGDVAIVVYSGQYVKTASKRTSCRTTRWCWGTLRHAVCAPMAAFRMRTHSAKALTPLPVTRKLGDHRHPAREFTMIQSAPLMLLADPDEFVSVQLA